MLYLIILIKLYYSLENFVITLDNSLHPVLNFIGEKNLDFGKYQIFIDNDLKDNKNLICKEINFLGNLPNNKNLNYTKVYCNLKIRENDYKKIDIYEKKANNSTIKLKSFHYESKLFLPNTNPEIIFFGNHDNSNNGKLLKDFLNLNSFDLIFFLGNYNNKFYENNMKIGENYFNSMENIYTKSPLLYTPGFNEFFNYTNNFNFKFQQPNILYDVSGFANSDSIKMNNNKTVIDFNEYNFRNNLYSFVIKNTLFLSINWDIVNFSVLDNESFYNWIKLELNQYIHNFKIKFKVLLSHRPYFCDKIDIISECYFNSFYNKPFYDLLIKHYHFQIFIAGNTLHYEKSFKFDNNLLLNNTSSKITQFIVGTGGNSTAYPNITKFNISHTDKFITKTKGFLKMIILENSLQFNFIKINNNTKEEEIEDSYTLNYDNTLYQNSERNIILNVFFIGLLFSIIYFLMNFII